MVKTFSVQLLLGVHILYYIKTIVIQNNPALQLIFMPEVNTDSTFRLKILLATLFHKGSIVFASFTHEVTIVTTVIWLYNEVDTAKTTTVGN